MKTTLQIEGMHCESCEMLIKDIISDLGVKLVSANHKTGKVEIDFNEKEIKLNEIKKTIEIEGDNYKVK